MALACGMIAVELARQAEWRPGDRQAHLALAILAVLSCITFYPALKAVTNGQAQSWLNCWLVLAGYAWLRNRRMLAGMLIGAICLLTNRAPALGLALLAPIMAVVVLFHAFLNPQGIPIAALLVVCGALLLRSYASRYAHLLEPGSTISHATAHTTGTSCRWLRDRSNR